MIRRLLLVVAAVLLLASPAAADISVVNGSYTHALRGSDVSSAFIQDITIADPTTGSRVAVTGGGVGVNVLSALPAGTNVIGHIICDSGCSSTSSPSYGAAFPATGTPIGLTDGTNLVALRARTSEPNSTDTAAVVRQVGIPAAGALSDGVSNPTVVAIGSYTLGFNGSNWDRIRSDATTMGLIISTGARTDADTGVGTQNLPLFLLGLPGNGGAGPVTSINPLPVYATPSGNNLCGGSTQLTIASVTRVNCSPTPAVLYGITHESLNTASPLCAYFYDTVASPAIGTDSPKMTFVLPPASAVKQVGGVMPPLTGDGVAFTNGLWLAITGLTGDLCGPTNSANAATGSLVNVIFRAS